VVPLKEKGHISGDWKVRVGVPFARGMRKLLYIVFWDSLFEFKLGELSQLFWVKIAVGTEFPLTKHGILGFKTIGKKTSRNFPFSFYGEYDLPEMALYSRKRPRYLI